MATTYVMTLMMTQVAIARQRESAVGLLDSRRTDGDVAPFSNSQPCSGCYHPLAGATCTLPAAIEGHFIDAG